jgi:hypothetical protein
MIIAVEGSKTFDDYETFMRGMGVALSDLGNDDTIEVWSAGPYKINSFTAAFCNSSENYLKQKGYRIKFSKVQQNWLSENISAVNHYAYFSNPNERPSRLTAEAELANIDVSIYRY